MTELQARECSVPPPPPVPLWTEAKAGEILESVCATYQDDRGINHIDGTNMPQRDGVLDVLETILEVLFPGYTGRHRCHRQGLRFIIGHHLEYIYRGLREQVERALAYECHTDECELRECSRMAEESVVGLLEKLPDIRETLKTDAQAALDGDPAARSTDEIVIAYPGLRAVAIHRVAHELYKAKIPLIPRVMGEHAHSITGIDIHPGATIGESFFIDHGTGVVIGETAIIGDNVKLYQGVTLGALSFPKDECGKLIKGAKRHPNIEHDVTVYSGATILGDITVGHHSVVGGNVWVTESLDPHTKVTIAPPELSIRTRGGRGGS
jgi:serine O-acetyltransferase